MNLKYVAILMLFFFLGNVYAQNELNPYKYIIVPKQFDFLKKENQYRVNSYTKFLFAEEGFDVFYDDALLPDDLVANPCMALRVNVLDKSSSFTTKLYISLENCAGNEIFRSIEGRSKMKEFDKTYIDALKKSFVSIQELDYSYEPETFISTSQVEESVSTKQVETAVVGSTVLSESKTAEKKEEVAQADTVSADINEGTNTNPSVTAAAPVVAVPIVAENKDVKAEDKPAEEANTAAEPLTSENVARAFQNENVSFLLLDQGAQLQAYVSQSKNKNYKPGELIGTFKRSSLPNVFKVSWKKPIDGIEETTAYFDEQGNLKIDVYQDGNLKTLTFTEVK